MHTERMRARVPGAVSRGRARLTGRRLVFNKRGRDGSAKANLMADPGGVVWGVVWEIEQPALAELDAHEAGYRRVCGSAETDDGGCLEVEIYVSTRLARDRRPFDWYLEHVLRGARGHGLPDAYVSWLAARPRRRSSDDHE